jgi:hypothetical protein
MFLEVPDWYENHANTIYNDFEFLDPGVGNNGFSMDRRRVRNRLQLTPLRLGSIDDVRIGQHVVFQDFVPDEQGNDVWQECRGLDANILCLDYDIPIYVFDNHNLVFYAWMEAVHLGWIGGGGMRCLSSDFIPMKSDTVSSCGLIHVDAHFDYNQPESVDVKFDSLHDVVKYLILFLILLRRKILMIPTLLLF